VKNLPTGRRLEYQRLAAGRTEDESLRSDGALFFVAPLRCYENLSGCALSVVLPSRRRGVAFSVRLLPGRGPL